MSLCTESASHTVRECIIKGALILKLGILILTNINEVITTQRYLAFAEVNKQAAPRGKQERCLKLS